MADSAPEAAPILRRRVSTIESELEEVPNPDQIRAQAMAARAAAAAAADGKAPAAVAAEPRGSSLYPRRFVTPGGMAMSLAADVVEDRDRRAAAAAAAAGTAGASAGAGDGASASPVVLTDGMPVPLPSQGVQLPSCSQFMSTLWGQIDRAADTMHIDLAFFCICFGCFICPPLFLPFFFAVTKGHRLFQLGLAHVLLVWPLICVNVYSFIATVEDDGVTPVVWSVRTADRLFPIVAYALLCCVYAAKYSVLDHSSGQASFDRVSRSAAAAARTAAAEAKEQRVFAFIQRHILPERENNPIYAFNSTCEVFTIKRSFILQWVLISRLVALPHLFFSVSYRYWVLSQPQASPDALQPHGGGTAAATAAASASASASAAASGVTGWIGDGWFESAHALCCAVAGFVIVGQLNFLILETFEFFLLRLRCIERFNQISAKPLALAEPPSSPPPSTHHDAADGDRKSASAPASAPPALPHVSSGVSGSVSGGSSGSVWESVRAAEFDWRSVSGVEFWFDVRQRTLSLFQVRFAGLQSVSGLLLGTGCGLLLYLVVQRSRLGNAFLLDDLSGRALLDVVLIVTFVFMLVHVSSAIATARGEEHARILLDKRVRLAFDADASARPDAARVQSALSNALAFVKETSEPPTVLGLRVNNGLADKVAGLAILALANVFTDVLSFFHVPSAKEVASAAIPLR